MRKQPRPSWKTKMKRALMALAGLYLLFALIGRFVESMGGIRCACADDCWCQRPILSTFRWVFPRGHRPRLPEHSRPQ